MQDVNTNENAICDLEYNSNCTLRYNIMDQNKITYALSCALNWSTHKKRFRVLFFCQRYRTKVNSMQRLSMLSRTAHIAHVQPNDDRK